MQKTTKLCNRYFCGIFYPEDPNYNDYKKNIIDNFEEVLWIDHNRDIDEKGDTKKLHTHIVFKVGENARHRTAISKIIGCPENMIEGCKQKPSILYLIHKNNPEKTQYQPEEVQGQRELLEELLLKNEDADNKVSLIFIAIFTNKITTMTELVAYCLENKLITTLQKYQMLFYNILKENKYNVSNELRRNENIRKSNKTNKVRDTERNIEYN